MPTEDEIRRLLYPRAPEWTAEGPSTQSLAEDISRWYENAGGLERAIGLAQDAGASWKPEAIYAKRPAVFEKTENGRYRSGEDNTMGSYDPTTGKVRLSPKFQESEQSHKGSGRQAILEHERSHGALGVEPLATDKPMAEAGGWWQTPGYGNYILTPSEMTVRLAQIKRRYANATGKIVDSPEEAEKALYWYMDNAPDEPKGPDRDPTGQGTAVEYLFQPAVRRKAVELMPKVVNADMLIGRLNT